MDILDTRDLLDELRALCGGDEDNPDPATVAELDDEGRERMEALRELFADVGSEAQDGVALIPEGDFEEYARELAEDIGAINHPEAAWPLSCIDWEQAARLLRQDYSEADFDGTTYLFRA